MRATNTEKEFWNKVDKSGDCWIWLGYKERDGYGIHRENWKEYRAHRYALEASGVDVTGKVVCHTCDNPSCVNPAHLFAGTQKDNMNDLARKGRSKGHKKPTYQCCHCKKIIAGKSNYDRWHNNNCKLFVSSIV